MPPLPGPTPTTDPPLILTHAAPPLPDPPPAIDIEPDMPDDASPELKHKEPESPVTALPLLMDTPPLLCEP